MIDMFQAIFQTLKMVFQKKLCNQLDLNQHCLLVERTLLHFLEIFHRAFFLKIFLPGLQQ